MKDLQEIQSISKLKVSATGIDGGCGAKMITRGSY